MRQLWILLVPVVLQSTGCEEPTTPLTPPAVALVAHASGAVKDANGQVLEGVDVIYTCPSPVNSPTYPPSARLKQSRASNVFGVYEAWLAVDEVSLRQAGREPVALTMDCHVSAEQDSKLFVVSPSVVAVSFAPVAVSPALTKADLVATR